MYVLVVASQKGGSGKTTISGHLAVEAQDAGFGPVALIDTDPQGSLSQWWDARKGSTPFFVTAGLLDLGETVEHLRAGGVRLVVIDTPPAITVSISQAIAHADLVVVPTRPSPHDLRAVGATVDIAERHQKPLIFVINAATPRARITGEAAIALSQHGTVAPVMLHHRVDFAASMVDGRTVGEVIAKCASANEIRMLWAYVQDRLSRLKKEARPVPAFLPAPSPAASDKADRMMAGKDGAPNSPAPALPVAAAAGNAAPATAERDERSGAMTPARELAPLDAPHRGLQTFGRRYSNQPIHSR